ncbi:unnamed protein product [Pleuronectes platessa]|uniref:Uncharacterized protein n=1 Tax=Pleuronectes platessa TaxID=8262 RepID=A0A9N7TKR5_PLEPL|nr:unnamed protein product [Pleuronectes platessa]
MDVFLSSADDCVTGSWSFLIVFIYHFIPELFGLGVSVELFPALPPGGWGGSRWFVYSLMLDAAVQREKGTPHPLTFLSVQFMLFSLSFNSELMSLSCKRLLSV